MSASQKVILLPKEKSSFVHHMLDFAQIIYTWLQFQLPWDKLEVILNICIRERDTDFPYWLLIVTFMLHSKPYTQKFEYTIKH
jgi:hypothetical protein